MFVIKNLLKPLFATLFFVFAIVTNLDFTLRNDDGKKGGCRRSSLVRRKVDDPGDLPKASWKLALKRTKEALKDKDLAASAAALAYYTTLTFFPALLGLASCYVIFASPQSLTSILHQLQTALPSSLATIVQRQLTPIAEGAAHKAGVAAILSIVTLLWTTSGGLQNLVKATNKAYEVTESRKFYKLRLVSIGLSVVVLIIGAAILGLLLLQASALSSLGAPHWMAVLFPVLRWPLLIILISILLSAIYRYAPDRKEPHWAWVSWGATAATIIWLAATVLFFVYVQHFGNYTKTYGTFAGIIILMIWFNISSLIVLLGAQVNKKLEEVSPQATQPKS